MADKNMNNMLNQLSGMLGMSQQQLEKAAKNGDIKNLLKNADEDKTNQIESILSDPEKTKKLLESPQAQALLKLFGGD